MFGRSILIFVFLLVCLGAGTIWVIETESGAHLFPRGHALGSNVKLSQLYNNGRYKIVDWWQHLTQSRTVAISDDKKETTIEQQKIVKWQDAQGTRHFEYEKNLPQQ